MPASANDTCCACRLESEIQQLVQLLIDMQFIIHEFLLCTVGTPPCGLVWVTIRTMPAFEVPMLVTERWRVSAVAHIAVKRRGYRPFLISDNRGVAVTGWMAMGSDPEVRVPLRENPSGVPVPALAICDNSVLCAIAFGCYVR